MDGAVGAPDVAHGALSSLLAQWIDSKRTYDPATLANTLIETLHARFMVVEPVDGRLTIVKVGSTRDATLPRIGIEHSRFLIVVTAKNRLLRYGA